MRGNVENKNNPVNIRFVDKTSDIRNLSENITSDAMFNISEVATLVSMILKFWCSLEVTAVELHLRFVIKCNLRWKRTFLPMVTIVVSPHKHMKLLKPFTQHVIAWSVRKGFNQSVCRTKVQKTILQSWASAGGKQNGFLPPPPWKSDLRSKIF